MKQSSGAAAPGGVRTTRAARLLLPAAIILPLVVAATGGWLLWRTLWNQAQTEIGRVAEAAAEYAQGLLIANAQLLDGLDDRLRGWSDAGIRSEEPWLRETLRNGIAARQLTRAVSILDAEAVPLASSAVHPPSPPEPDGRTIAGLASGTGMPYAVSSIHAGPAGVGEPVFSILRRREGVPAPDRPGVILVSLDVGQVGEGLARLAAGSGDVITLMHATDTAILARSAGLPAGGVLRPPPDSPLARAVLGREMPPPMLLRSSLDGTWRLAGIRFVPGWPVAAIAARPRAAITARWLQSALPLATLGVLASIALGLFARLVRRVQDALADANRELERRVAERTVELAERSHDLARNEERLRIATEAAKLGIWEVDLVAGVARRSPLALSIFGYGSDAEIGVYPSWRDRIHPEDKEEALRMIGAGVAGEVEEYATTYRFRRPDGHWIWIESHGRVVERDPGTGKPRRLAGTSQDITERKEAEARQTLLAREVDHRAKNALAVVTAALRLTPRDDPERFASVIEGRVAALARAHTLLARGRWTGAELRMVIDGELAPFLGRGADGPHAIVDGPPVRLHAAAVQSLSMLLHELATNAAKHGALSRRAGHLTVRWEIRNDTGDGARLHLFWEEHGGPAIFGPPQRRGFGSSLIEATVEHNLGGTVRACWRPEGLAWEACMALAEIGEASTTPGPR